MSIIEVNHLSKAYDLGAVTSIKDSLRHTLAKIQGKGTWQRERFKALDDVNFTIEEGEVVGIIGHNGAGKSTLLKHLANITKPTSGEVIVRGSIAPLIEVGAGVNPELTGRENIFLNGAILGIPKKMIQNKLDEIIDFSELEQFIDTPVKRYSSGMTVKLGFSIATSLDADILIIDEVLAVGDLAFQRKCFNRMNRIIKNQGCTVLIVGHNIRQLEQLCTRMLMLDKGRIKIDGSPTEVCTQFIQQNNDKIKNQQKNISNIDKSSELESIQVEVLDSEDNKIERIEYNREFKVRIEFNLLQPIKNLTCFISIHTTDFVQITANETFTTPRDFVTGDSFFEMTCPAITVLPGVYSIKVWVGTVDGQVKFEANNLANFQIFSDDYAVSRLQDLGLMQLDSRWDSGSVISEVN